MGKDAIGGSGVNSMVAMLCGELCGVSTEAMLPFCSAIELLHNFSLIHDDIEDADEKRRGRETVWKRWGIPQAINVGDLLFSLAAESILRAGGLLPNERIFSALKAYYKTCDALTTGQHLDMAFEHMDLVAPDDYLYMIRGKTAALLGYSTMVGAIASGKPAEQIKLFSDFGINLGIAFQMQDDYLGIWGEISKTGKAGRSDLLARKKTYPILCGLANGKKFLQLWHASEEITHDLADELAQALDEEGINDLVLNEVKRYTEVAVNSLHQIANHQSTAGKILFELSGELMQRTF